MLIGNFKFLKWNSLFIISNPVHRYINFLSRNHTTFSDNVTVWNIIHMLQTFYDCIRHGFFFPDPKYQASKDQNYFQTKYLIIPGWCQLETLIRYPVSNGREEKINIWKFIVNFFTFNHCMVSVENSPGKRVWNSLSAVWIKNFGFFMVETVIKKSLHGRTSYNQISNGLIETLKFHHFGVIAWPGKFYFVFFQGVKANTFLSFSVAALVIETRFAFLKPGEIPPRKKKLKFF